MKNNHDIRNQLPVFMPVLDGYNSAENGENYTP